MRILLASLWLALALSGAEAQFISGTSSTGSGTSSLSNTLPCDAYADAGYTCVAAYSVTRALFGSYSGNLYQVTRASDSTTTNIAPVAAGGMANSATQDTFCSATTCTITQIYDQSGNACHLTVAAGLAAASATKLPTSVNGVKIYGVQTQSGQGYHSTINVACTNVPTGSASAETIYAVFGGTWVGGGCCFDFGNMEPNELDNGNGHMHALSYQQPTGIGKGSGAGPWIMTDLENCDTAVNNCGTNPNNNSLNQGQFNNFIMGMAKVDGAGNFSIASGDPISQSLVTWFSGPLPAGGWGTMHMEGAVGLGIGGDLSHAEPGAFYEGAIISANTSAAADTVVQSNISRVYGSPSPQFSPSSLGGSLLAWFDASNAASFTYGSGIPPYGNGQSVASWKDLSSNGYVVSQATTANQPIRQPSFLNGKSGVAFVRGSSMNLAGAAAFSGLQSPFSFFIVEQPDPADNGNFATTFSNNSPSGKAPCFVWNNASPNAWHLGICGSADFGYSTGFNMQNWVPHIEVSTSSTGYPTVNGNNLSATGYVDGTTIGTISQTDNSAGTDTGIMIGNDPTMTSAYGGIINEIIVVSGVVSTTTQQKIEGYLACKWGTQGFLPAGHPFKIACP